MGAAINVNQRRVFLSGLLSRRCYQSVVQVCLAVGGLDCSYVVCGHGVFFQRIFRGVEGFLRSVPSHDAVVCSRWHLHAAPEVHIAGAVVAHHYRVGSVGLPVARFGQAFHLAAFQVHLVGIAAHEVVFVGVHEDVLSALVEADESFHFKLPLGHLTNQVSVGVVEIQMFVSVSHREPQELVPFGGEDHSVNRLHIPFVLLLEEHLLTFARSRVVLLHPHVVLLSVYLRHIDVFLVGAPRDVCQIHLLLLDALVLACLEVDLLHRYGVVNSDGDLVALHSGHRVFYRFRLSLAGFGVHDGVVFHHALIHAVEGQPRLSGRPEDSLVDAELVAVHAFAQHDVITVARLNQLVVHIKASVFCLHTLVCRGFQHILIFIFLLGGEHLRHLSVEHIGLVTSRIHHPLRTRFEDDAAYLSLGIQAVIHQLLPIQHLVLSEGRQSAEQ